MLKNSHLLSVIRRYEFNRVVDILKMDGNLNLSEAVLKAAAAAALGTLPTISKPRYLKSYGAFELWKKENNVGDICEKVLMAYLYELSEKHKPTTIWSTYSMLKSTLKVKENIDIGKYHQLSAFLKQNAIGYEPIKAKILTESEVERFLSEASDLQWLDVKVATIFGMCGALRGTEMVKITTEDLEYHNKMILVNIPVTKTRKARSFTVSGNFYDIVLRYAGLRVPDTPNNRFFVNYQHGKCTKQVIGYHKLSDMPRRVAEFLKLNDVESYKGHSFRRTSTSILANSGASIERVQAHGGWSSSKVARGYVEESLPHKKQTEARIVNSILSSNGASSSSTNVQMNSILSSNGTSSRSTNVQMNSILSSIGASSNSAKTELSNDLVVACSQGYIEAECEESIDDKQLLEELDAVEMPRKRNDESNRFVFKDCHINITFK